MTVKELKGHILLSVTNNKPFLMRYELNGDCNIKELIDLSRQHHEKTVDNKKEYNQGKDVIEVWTDF